MWGDAEQTWKFCGVFAQMRCASFYTKKHLLTEMVSVDRTFLPITIGTNITILRLQFPFCPMPLGYFLGNSHTKAGDTHRHTYRRQFRVKVPHLLLP